MRETVREIATILFSKHGKDISAYDLGFLARAIQRRMAEAGLLDLKSYIVFFETDDAEAEIFYRSLAINYSEFFRFPLSFDVLEYVALPEIIQKSKTYKHLRVWDAGCARGEEAYSTGIILNELSEVFKGRLAYTIFATDVAADEIEFAKLGVYDDAALRNVRMGRFSRCFRREGELYSVLPELKENIYFSVHDLLDQTEKIPQESVYGGFDMIFCCNLLYYYTPKARNFILEKLVDALSLGGLLITGETERLHISEAHNLSEIMSPSAVYKKKKRG